MSFVFVLAELSKELPDGARSLEGHHGFVYTGYIGSIWEYIKGVYGDHIRIMSWLVGNRE